MPITVLKSGKKPEKKDYAFGLNIPGLIQNNANAVGVKLFKPKIVMPRTWVAGDTYGTGSAYPSLSQIKPDYKLHINIECTQTGTVNLNTLRTQVSSILDLANPDVVTYGRLTNGLNAPNGTESDPDNYFPALEAVVGECRKRNILVGSFEFYLFYQFVAGNFVRTNQISRAWNLLRGFDDSEADAFISTPVLTSFMTLANFQAFERFFARFRDSGVDFISFPYVKATNYEGNIPSAVQDCVEFIKNATGKKVFIPRIQITNLSYQFTPAGITALMDKLTSLDLVGFSFYGLSTDTNGIISSTGQMTDIGQIIETYRDNLG